MGLWTGSEQKRGASHVGGGFEDTVLPVMRFQKPPAFFSPLPPPPPPSAAPFGVDIAAQSRCLSAARRALSFGRPRQACPGSQVGEASYGPPLSRVHQITRQPG